MIQMRCSQVVIFPLILFFSILLTNFHQSTSYTSTNGNFSFELPGLVTDHRFLTQMYFSIVFVGYDQSLIDTDYFDYTDIYEIYSNYEIDAPLFSIISDVQFANDSYFNALKSYLDSIAISGDDIGTDLNITALRDDIANPPQKSDIFYPRGGTKFNASLVEMWLDDHPYTHPIIDYPHYYLYMLNFSLYDTEDHIVEHWYDIPEYDPDTECNGTCWYSGYDGLFERPVPGWSSATGTAFYDPSAFQWYLKWVPVGWGESDIIEGCNNSYGWQDLEEYSDNHPITNPSDVTLEEYLANFVDDYFWNNIFGYVYTPKHNLNHQQYSIQIMVIDNITANDANYGDLSWIFDENLIEESLEEVAPYSNWNVSRTIRPLDNLTVINDIIREVAVWQGDYYDVEVTDSNNKYDLSLLDYLEQSLELYFIQNPAVTGFPAYVFLNWDIIFTYSGTRIAGLGGMGWELIGRLLNSSNQKRSGLSHVIIHEAGHTLGFPHPHSQSQMNYWAGDFVDSVMSYYPYSNTFSKFQHDQLGRVTACLSLIPMIRKLQRMENEGITIRFRTQQDAVSLVKNYIHQAIKDYDNTSFVNLKDVLTILPDLITDFEKTLDLTSGEPTGSWTTLTTVVSQPSSESIPGLSFPIILISIPIIIIYHKRKKS